VKIIDIDLQRRRISLSIKQAAEGGEVSEEYREAFGEHAYDEQGNYIGVDFAGGSEFTPETEAQAAWAEYVAEHGTPPEGAEAPGSPPPVAPPAAEQGNGHVPEASPPAGEAAVAAEAVAAPAAEEVTAATGEGAEGAATGEGTES
jgi:small subunit ribosomal protein S1